MSRFSRSIPLLLLAITGAQTVFAAPTAGVLLGVTFPSAGGSSSRFGYGIEGDYPMMGPWTLGAYLLNSTKDEVSVNVRYTQFGLQGRFIVENVPGLAVGARVGLTNGRAELIPSGSSSSGTDFSFGPMATYDYTVAPNLSAGADLSLLFVTASSSYNLFNLLGALKYHFG